MDLQLRCSLSVFIASAKLRWGGKVSQRMVAKATGLTPTTVTKLANDVLMEINIKTLGLLCAYFWCQPGEILTLTGETSDMRALRRPQRPDVVKPLPVLNHMRTKLEQAPERAAHLTLGRNTIWRLRTQPAPSRISADVLIALAVAFNTTDIHEFLSVELPIDTAQA